MLRFAAPSLAGIIRIRLGGKTMAIAEARAAEPIAQIRRGSAGGRNPTRLQFRRRCAADAISMPAAPTSRPISTRAARRPTASSPIASRASAPRCAASASSARSACCSRCIDTIDWPTAFLGCLKAGIIAVPVNTLLTEDDYRFMLADSRAKCLVVSEALFPKFEKLIKQSPTSSMSSSPATIHTATGCSRI